ncbi:MAG: hypothetical protein OEW65_11430 [Thermoleophilia bacterium]|nr:hypothetical protein [Thermoleophilia bacterium]
MSKTRLALTLLTTVAMCLTVTAAASADPKVGCPVGEGWAEMTVVSAANEVFPNLIPGYPWTSADELAAFVDATYDKNDDGAICLKTISGDDLNPKSHWFRVGIDLGFGTGVSFYMARDNNANASNNA